MGCPVDCSNGLSADYSDGLSGGLSGGLHCPAGQSLEWSLDRLRKIVPVSTIKFYNFPDYCPVRTPPDSGGVRPDNVGDCKDLEKAVDTPPTCSWWVEVFRGIEGSDSGNQPWSNVLDCLRADGRVKGAVKGAGTGRWSRSGAWGSDAGCVWILFSYNDPIHVVSWYHIASDKAWVSTHVKYLCLQRHELLYPPHHRTFPLSLVQHWYIGLMEPEEKRPCH